MSAKDDTPDSLSAQASIQPATCFLPRPGVSPFKCDIGGMGQAKRGHRQQQGCGRAARQENSGRKPGGGGAWRCGGKLHRAGWHLAGRKNGQSHPRYRLTGTQTHPQATWPSLPFPFPGGRMGEPGPDRGAGGAAPELGRPERPPLHTLFLFPPPPLPLELSWNLGLLGSLAHDPAPLPPPCPLPPPPRPLPRPPPPPRPKPPLLCGRKPRPPLPEPRPKNMEMCAAGVCTRRGGGRARGRPAPRLICSGNAVMAPPTWMITRHIQVC